MATSQNGWSVISAAQRQKWVIPTTSRYFYIHDGDAGFVLACTALWFHRNVEPIDVGIWDDWGWADRNVRGSSTDVSNHASGTAIDINSTHHPLGVDNTFPLAKTLLIHGRMLRTVGILRWGGDYHGRKDSMHFEVNSTPDRVHSLAVRYAKQPVGHEVIAANASYRPPVTFEPGDRNLHIGSRGSDVSFVQAHVGATVDGVYGPATAKKVSQWEQSQKKKFPKMKVDGIVGPLTWRSMGIKPKHKHK